jgi:hypothetical protein
VRWHTQGLGATVARRETNAGAQAGTTAARRHSTRGYATQRRVAQQTTCNTAPGNRVAPPARGVEAAARRQVQRGTSTSPDATREARVRGDSATGTTQRGSPTASVFTGKRMLSVAPAGFGRLNVSNRFAGRSADRPVGAADVVEPGAPFDDMRVMRAPASSCLMRLSISADGATGQRQRHAAHVARQHRTTNANVTILK